jgi:hypothetical protein
MGSLRQSVAHPVSAPPHPFEGDARAREGRYARGGVGRATLASAKGGVVSNLYPALRSERRGTPRCPPGSARSASR